MGCVAPNRISHACKATPSTHHPACTVPELGTQHPPTCCIPADCHLRAFSAFCRRTLHPTSPRPPPLVRLKRTPAVSRGSVRQSPSIRCGSCILGCTAPTYVTPCPDRMSLERRRSRTPSSWSRTEHPSGSIASHHVAAALCGRPPQATTPLKQGPPLAVYISAVHSSVRDQAPGVLLSDRCMCG